ncbi:MAG: RagB/SusD family nutrient uptake outer membrane protein [Gemmatimonadetes bacterium]|nr:RagB/SusD family nutrient uptake outer membrane protein [Gemmatimonadota bacterium]
MKRRTLRATRRHVAAFAAIAVAAAACGDISVPEYNNPSIEELLGNPTPAAVRAAATGLMIGARAGLTDRTGYVSMLGVVGRESYTLDSSDPRYVSELLQGPLTNSGAFGAGMWTERYANIRNANLLLQALDKVQGFSAPQQEAIRGWAKTFQAMDFLLVINTRDVNGAPIAVSGGIRDVAPFATKPEVFQHVVTLLDQGNAHLQAGGGSFPFTVGPGFAGFNTPATFARFNRALRARVGAYMGNYQTVLSVLPQTFIAPDGDLRLGVYHTFSSAEGQPNQLSTLLNYARPGLLAEAERKPDGSLDQRVQSKVGPHPNGERTTQGLTSNLRFTLYTEASSRLPIIHNEELILLRAEARWFTGDRAGATDDLNRIRTRSGGLAPVAQPASDAAFVTELLKQRRYSLLMEGGHSWIDARRFGRLGSLPRDVATHTVVPAWQIPESECLARELASPCNVGG